ncbi:OmpH family outer membrane protein [bacterium]|nr:OmpH family outer membrane protein [bacterium]
MNKKIFAAGLAVVFLFCAGSVMAQLKLGYVDSQRILASNEAAQDAQKKLETETGKWTQELQKMEQEIQGKVESLEQQSLLLSEEKKQERIQELQNLQLQAQQYQYEKFGENGEVYTLRKQLLEPVIEKINTAIHKVGEDGGYDFIFDTVNGNVLYAQDKYDLTDQVIEELEKGKAASSTK